MKLAEALILRAGMMKRCHELENRILRNAKHQEGNAPAEDPNELLSDFNEIMKEFGKLVARINKTNISTILNAEKTICEALSERDVLGIRHELYSKLAGSATPQQDRYAKSEIRFVSSVNVRETQLESDRIAKAYRELDAEIQSKNWETELMD